MTTGQYGRQVPATLYGQQQVQARVTAGRLAVARPHEPRQVDVTRGCFAPVYGLRQLVSRTNHRHLTKLILKMRFDGLHYQSVGWRERTGAVPFESFDLTHSQFTALSPVIILNNTSPLSITTH
ncbi:unnamed protein product [Pieris brassicae]|uniref:YDG domain-containing protein n=1 Tax=Pieris brassicae TaxID=7116 RepID=A0A9P0T341_PIEBR|nr:unnamed protein product [Pieris brassicae]